MSHYVAVWAARQGLLREKAICGRFVLPFEQDCLHPTCPACVELIAADEIRIQGERIAAQTLEQAYDRR